MIVTPLVSFLIPAYNHAGYVEQCLDSILAEPYENKEIVVIDDGSKDDTAAVIERWIARHGDAIAVQFRTRPNKGLTKTLNELLGLARGGMVRLGASDDWFLGGGTRKLVDYLLAHPSKVAVAGDYAVVDDEGQHVYDSGITQLHRVDKGLYAREASIVTAVIAHWALAGPVPLIRKEFIVSIGGWDEDLRIDDWDFFLRIVAVDGLGFVDAPVCAYRLHDWNTCRVTDVPTRVRNLEEASKVAARHVTRFAPPHSWLLRSRSYLMTAKAAYLERRHIAVLANMTAYAANRFAAACGQWALRAKGGR